MLNGYLASVNDEVQDLKEQPDILNVTRIICVLFTSQIK